MLRSSSSADIPADVPADSSPVSDARVQVSAKTITVKITGRSLIEDPRFVMPRHDGLASQPT
jgi:hypothetical protein